ncbi:MAG: xanthine dehydrogenase family protein molybdopterin-binding subunit [Planctomycetes bacterium]|nr:xanthine dehydrogenase family protein molybdopterin-binding subunit [Planctomycetota bacterium]
MTAPDSNAAQIAAAAAAANALPPAADERPEWTPRAEMTVLNREIPRLDGPQKVTGRARYTHDVRLPGMVYARLVVTPYARADVGRISLTAARKVPGVVYAETVKADDEGVRYQGYDGILVVVAAETPEAAEDGVRAVRAKVTPLRPPLVTPEQALADGAPQITRRGNVSSESSRGDSDAAAAALEGCDAVVEATYTLPVQHHVCLETHGCVVDYRGGDSATVYHSSQYVTGGPQEFAQYLELPRGNVRVICEHMGGGFGSKFGAGTEGLLACQTAKALGRPVHLMLTREDEFLMAGNRSGSKQRMVGGATKDGKLRALLVEADRLGGVGQGSLPTPPYIYDVETSWSRLRSVHTATDSNRAQRSPGHPQASFAMESLVDELAYALSIDPLAMRLANLSDPVYHRQLQRAAREIGWDAHPHKTAHGAPDADGRALGIGFGVSTWGSSSRPDAIVEVRIHPDGSLEVSNAVQDIGQGSRTLVAAIVAEEFGLPVSAVTPRIGDSSLPTSVYSGGSITTGSVAPAVKDAAFNARTALAARVATALGVEPDTLVFRGGRVEVRDDPSVGMSWKGACALLGGDPLTASGKYRDHLHGERVHGAQAAKVSVDVLTGRVRVLRMVCVQDQGIPFNRMALRSQINGGLIQALSYGLFEERVIDPIHGVMLSDDLEAYKIAGAQEMPEFTVILDDDDDRQAAMGMAEAPNIPGHGAIANAVYNACGVRVRDMPLTPDKILTKWLEMQR